MAPEQDISHITKCEPIMHRLSHSSKGASPFSEPLKHIPGAFRGISLARSPLDLALRYSEVEVVVAAEAKQSASFALLYCWSSM